MNSVSSGLLFGAALLAAPALIAQSSVLEDNFETYADQAALDAAWPRLTGAEPNISDLQTSDPDATANRSVLSEGGNRERVFGERIPTDEAPVIFSFRFYDPFVTVPVDPEDPDSPRFPTTGREYAEIRLAGANVFAAGLHNSVNDGVFTAAKYQARALNGPGWIQLDADRSPGWQTFTIVLRATTFDVYVNGVLDPNATNRNWSNQGVDRVRLGGGLSTQTPARFDDISVTIGTAPAITVTEQPEAKNVLIGGNASFSVEAIGPGTLSYLWRRNGVPLEDNARISGATTQNLSITDLTPDDAGNYSVLITNDLGDSVQSANALLIVVPLGDFIVDDADPEPLFTLSGTWSTSAFGAPFGGTARFASLIEFEADRTATYTPQLPEDPRTYNLFTWYTAGGNRTVDAQYIINHQDGQTIVYVNQQENGSQWVPLAEGLTFAAGDSVTITNLTSNPVIGGVVIADAVRWVEVVPAPPAPPVLVPDVDVSQGVARITLKGVPNTTYRIVASDDLVNWTTLTIDTTDGDGNLVVEDPLFALLPKRFYAIAD
ncbi:MAG: hypothetical protein EA425_17915 [Puniceicoccaceae bacterium]|nr:MAG: hypothetical protein EA425_17915 [Puniceicoccaceae bacterium]